MSIFRRHSLVSRLAGTLPLVVAAAAQTPPAPSATVRLDAYRVEGRYTLLDPKPATTSSVVSAEEAQTYNVIVVEDALKYLPNLAFRRRFVGDVNSGISIRGTRHDQTARTIVQADGLLLSDFLNNGLANSPRFSLVAPEEIERSELVFGSFSAAYGGNALAGVMSFTTRTPERLEASVKATWFFHDYQEYESDQVFRGSNYAVSVGNRSGKFSAFLFYNRLRNETHPIDYRFIVLGSTTAPNATPATVVSGGFRDQDLVGADRFLYGEAGPIQVAHDLVKLKLGYDLSPQTRLRANLIWWGNDENRLEPRSYLKDAGGQPVNAGRVQLDGRVFTIPNADFSLYRWQRGNVLGALGLDHRFDRGWELSVLGSVYDVIKFQNRASNQPHPVGVNGGSGLITTYGDTGWRTFDARLASPASGAGHAALLGYHHDEYTLESDQFNATDWRSRATRTTLADGNYGTTALHALFVQDTWRFAPEWTLTAGLRAEQWNAYDGAKARDLAPNVRSRTALPARDGANLAPKAVLAFRPAGEPGWELRASAARATRYPTVGELFQGTVAADGAITRNDPNLKPERGTMLDLTTERRFRGGAFRLTLFQEEMRDTLLNQLNVNTRITNVQNLDDVRTRGVEAAFEQRRLLATAVDLYANVTYTDAIIRRNANFPASNGKVMPRIPEWQAKALLTYRPAKSWTITAGARYAADPFWNADNTDFRHGNYWTITGYFLVEGKVSWQGPRGLTASLGVDNATNDRHYVVHPLPMRTTFVELGWKL
ncbi:MAG: TonB-dependent receptor [Opitutaceae bacterium]|nr:TonB-dependent receptor [Opitutaceae bacterium]